MHVLSAYINKPSGSPLYKEKVGKPVAGAPSAQGGLLILQNTENSCDTEAILYNTSENRRKRKEQNELNNHEKAKVINNDQIDSMNTEKNQNQSESFNLSRHVDHLVDFFDGQ